MALIDIISLIESEAAEKAASLLTKAKEEVETLQKDSKELTADAVALLKKEGEEERSALEKRATSQSLRTERMAISTAQQEVVDTVFTKVEEQLNKLSGEDLTSVFSSLVSGVSAEKGEVVVLGKGKKEMEVALAASKKTFSVSEDKKSSQGGFIFKGDGFDMDFSFATVVEKELRPSEEGKVFKELF